MNLYKIGRKSIPILLEATSPEGETKMFTSIGEAAKEWGFIKHGVGKAFHEKRNRIGGYELEWLEPKPDVDPKAASRMERLKRVLTQTVCTYCNKPLTREDRVRDGFGVSELDEKTGHLTEDHDVNSKNEAHKITGLSVSSLKNAADKVHSKEIIADVNNLPDEKLIWLNRECNDEYLPEDVKVVDDSGSNMFRATQNEGSSL